MAPMILWLAKLLALLGGFLHDNPIPLHERLMARRLAAARPGVCVVIAKRPGERLTPADAAQAQAFLEILQAQAPKGEVVIDTATQAEGGRNVTYQWVARASEPGVLFLYREGVQIGGWNIAHRVYLDYDAATNRWATVRRQVCGAGGCRLVETPAWKDCPPCPLPNEARPAGVGAGPPEQPPTGVNFEKLRDKGHKYMHGDRDVTREHSIEAFDGNRPPSDGDRLRITCVGLASAQKLRQDLAGDAALAAWANKVSVQSYASADDPMLKGLGFAPGGVQVQSPNGVPLWFAATYDGPRQLADGLMLADARRKDAEWDPRKWPELAKPAIVPAPPGPADPAPAPGDRSPVYCLLGGAALVALVWLRVRRAAAA